MKDPYGISSAVRPWLSTDSVPPYDFGIGNGIIGGQAGHHAITKRVQNEIDACLHCPFASCEGTGNKCRSFRAHYIAKMEHRE